ncbi:FRAS1-related extracellular matrix protein 1-like [Sinocyclocheilus anshuiensis]|uniref:FRAS1-related extracellular matrix protein 1-like n=1 Tax=Sinocyclocheilus anshuiensis TaxID=1608454 RepID=UPI0007BA59AA|nr:PREDICTED: FRAS1-related extracellular matrix protein 1-like [Sinocyclocheilus anshuiensis]
MGVNIFALTVFTLSHLWPHVQASSVVRLNTGLRVTRGQSVFVTAGELQFHTDGVSEACKVEVVLTEPITQRVGKLTPQVFDCQFFPDEVTYVHNGSPLLEEDTVMLRVYRFTETETFVETVLLKVHVVEPQRSLTELGNVPLVVSEFYSLSNAINSSVLTFKNQPEVICTVRLLSSEINIPMLGQLVTEDPESMPASEPGPRKGRHTGITCPGNKVCDHNTREVEFLKTDCAEFLTSGLKYQHLSPPSPEIDYIPIRVEFRDQTSRAMLETESIWIPVLIQGAMQNQPPSAAFMSTFILEVDQFILTPMTTAALDAKDDETPQARLIFNVTKPPAEGYITHLDDHTKTAFSFSWQDLNEMKIAYQPPNSSHTARRNYEVEFQAIDGSFVPSPPILMHISIRTAETNAPRVSWNMGLDLLEGQSRPITWEHLQVVDNDNIDAVTLIAMDGPLNGHLSVRDLKRRDSDPWDSPQSAFGQMESCRPMSSSVEYDSTNSMKKDAMVPVLKSFTQHAVNHHKVAYMPPIEDIGPEPLFVQFVLSVSDQQGGALTGLTFNITVIPVDNQAPEMFTNLLRVEEGGGSFLMEEHLLVQDVDSSEDQLRVHMKTQPQHGRLELQGTAMLEGDSFSLQDLKALRVRYIHDDSETLKDSIGLTITDGINSAYGTLLVQILPVNDEPPQLGYDLRAELSCKEGGQVHITVEYLSATDVDSEDTRLTYMLARTPARGVLQRNGVTVDKFSQLDMLNGLIFYLHTGGEIGPDPVSDTVTLIVSDGEAGTIDDCCQEDALPPPVPLHGTLPVCDLNITVMPVNNQVPTITLGNMFVVDEGASACLCGGVLEASDPDSHPDQLMFHLVTPPQYGFLENTLPSPGFEKSNAGLRVVSFSQLHLSSGFINYVQSVHKGVEPTADFFTITVSDGIQRSAPLPFYIIINPTNDEIPSLLLSNFTVMEGGMKDLSPDILNAVDGDIPADTLTMTILFPPAHGTLVNGIYGLKMNRYKNMNPEVLQRTLPIQSFTLQELQQGMKIMYMHDDTETLKDAFTIQLTDGGHTVQGTACVRIIPVNDEKPWLLKNAGIEVEALEKRVISSAVLEAGDHDTSNDHLLYILNAGPRFGLLQLRTEAGWIDLSPGQNFTQEDVEMNRLWYTHTTVSGFKGHDRFHFVLSDGENTTPPQSFFISVRTVQKGEITLITKPVTLMEGERVILTTDILMATDSGSEPDELIYTVSVPPEHGHLHMVQSPGIPVLSFSQMDVAANRVCYTHDNSRFADRDSFSFAVTNGVTSRRGTIHFTVEHSDRIPPTLTINKGLELTEGSMKTISTDDLKLTDPDTALENLTYIVIQSPQYGKLLLKRLPISKPRFTQLDINNMDLAYHHLNGQAKIDRFTFQPTDGTNTGYLEYGQLKREPAVFTIQIEILDKIPPSVINKGIPSTVENFLNGKQGIYITSKELRASDPDSPDDTLEFTITRPPHFGYLENALTGAYIKGRFTQKDLEQKAVRYVIPADMEVTADSFEFQVTDPAGNTMLPEVMEFRWSRVELSASCYRVCENTGTLALQVVRSGNGKDPAYIGIQVEEGTAKVGKDFTHSSANLIQFDPGVNVKMWNIYFKDDRLEENHEKFDVVLKTPKNAVLGQRNKATVEIVDPRNGRCNPDELIVEEDEKQHPFQNPPRIPEPEPPLLEEYTPDPRSGVLWENYPPRGDVPYRTHFSHYSEGEHQDQEAFHSPGQRQLRFLGRNGHRPHLSEVDKRNQERVWRFHGLIPVRVEEKALAPRVHSELEITPIWTWPGYSAESVETPQHDSASFVVDSGVQQHKSQKSVSIDCPNGWTHYRRNCYILGPGSASWSSTQHACMLLESELASIHSKTDMKWMWKFAGKQSFWIGLSGGPKQWCWTDGKPLTFSKLRKDHEAHTSSDASCVLAQSQKIWIPKSCIDGSEHRYVCSAPAQIS